MKKYYPICVLLIIVLLFSSCSKTESGRSVPKGQASDSEQQNALKKTSSEPTRDETIEFMKAKLQYTAYSVGDCERPPNEITISGTILQCLVIMKCQKFESKRNITVDLKDLDPSAVIVTTLKDSQIPGVKFICTLGKQCIKGSLVSSSDGNQPHDFTTPDDMIYFNPEKKEHAQKFADALSHLIKLSGGQQEKF